MDHRWLLAHDNEGEVYTRPHTNKALIREVLQLFNGSTTFYCCLYDNTDESCLWCVGEPDRRIVEGRLIEDDTIFHFVLRKKAHMLGEKVTVRYGMPPDELVTVDASEILTAEEATKAYLAFHRNKSIPDEFDPIPKPCLFGSQSFKD
jgi:hypothetical protein